jgi:hypothetical protein
MGNYIYVADGYSIKVLDRVNLDGTPANTEPIIANAIGGQTAYQNKSFSFTVPDYIFADAGDSLTYSATLGDGSVLPSWLSFNAATRTFSGTPINTGNLNLKITATDSSGKTASDTFLFSILTGNYDTFGSAYDLAVQGNYAYVADGYSGVQILNISNLTSPTHVGDYYSSDNVQDVDISGDYAYVANSYSGIQILNISNANNPTLVGSYDTPDNANGIAVVNNYVYVADGSSGVLIFNVKLSQNVTILTRLQNRA